MKITKDIDFSKVKDTSKNEIVVKSWLLTKQEQTDTNSIMIKNRVTLTDKRLITTSTVNNDSYQKTSYMLDDIHAVNCFVGQHNTPSKLFLSLGIICLVLGLACLGVAIGVPSVATGLYIASPFLIAASLVFFFVKNKEVGVTISLELGNTKHVEIAESETSNKVDLSKEKQIKLSFEPCKEAVEMALELDVLVMNAKDGIYEVEEQPKIEPEVKEKKKKEKPAKKTKQEKNAEEVKEEK